MTLDVRATPYFQHGDLDQLTIHLNTPETIKSFGLLLDKVLNTWEDAPPEWKELSDKITHGKRLQDYYKQVRAKSPNIQTQAVILTEPLPICPDCGQKGYGHLSTCPAIQKK